ncbi:hypothetical protein IMZ48_22960 [Candidatus Bathyarchaeota archaeon]|nr:hypothetical protein [Candidatus Bathyarchaeota archaeon]
MEQDAGSNSPIKNNLNIKTIFFYNKRINRIAAAVFLATISAHLFKLRIPISETALYYFLSSIAQSMAAIIALAGTVAIFRYSFLIDKRKATLIRIRGASGLNHPKWVDSQQRLNMIFRPNEVYWQDDEFLAKLIELRDKARGGNPMFVPDLEGWIKDLTDDEARLRNYVPHLRPAVLSSFITFILSVLLIPCSEFMADKTMGVFSLELFAFLILITSRNLYNYFITTAATHKGD